MLHGSGKRWCLVPGFLVVGHGYRGGCHRTEGLVTMGLVALATFPPAIFPWALVPLPLLRARNTEPPFSSLPSPAVNVGLLPLEAVKLCSTCIPQLFCKVDDLFVFLSHLLNGLLLH